MRRVETRSGAALPVLGQGTWRMGEDPRRRAAEIAALRLGLDLGMALVDTAEMYADGEAERIAGEAIRGRRDAVFVVSKVLPQNASREGTLRAAQASLRRLGTDRIDLYLLHWPGSHPLEETLDAFARLRERGDILHYGVSNFDREEMSAAEALRGGEGIAANQVLYNLGRRGIERGLIAQCTARGIPIMAYSPIEQGRLARKPALGRVARRLGVTPEQVAIAWTIRRPAVVSIPKATDPRHVRDNAAAADLELGPEDLEELDRAYPVPPRDVPLEAL